MNREPAANQDGENATAEQSTQDQEMATTPPAPTAEAASPNGAPGQPQQAGALPQATEQAQPTRPELQQQLDEAKSQAAEYLDGWQRARAELSNYKKRQERERAEMAQLANERLISRLLPVLDDFERAFQTRPQGLEHLTWLDGVFLVQRRLQMILEAEGLKEIEAQGQPFDPMVHEAIGSVDPTSEVPAGHVAKVLQKGYKLGDRVIRPALVEVSR